MQFLGDNRVSVNPQAAMEHMMGQQPAEEKPAEEEKEEVPSYGTEPWPAATR